MQSVMLLHDNLFQIVHVHLIEIHQEHHIILQFHICRILAKLRQRDLLERAKVHNVIQIGLHSLREVLNREKTDFNGINR